MRSGGHVNGRLVQEEETVVFRTLRRSMVRDNLERFQSVVFHSCHSMVPSGDNLERTGRSEMAGTCASEDARLEVQEEEQQESRMSSCPPMVRAIPERRANTSGI